jgi:hypothetical protein
MRVFRLSSQGVRCGEDGLFVGSAALLMKVRQPPGRGSWVPRPTDELDSDLGDLYGLPIDAAGKREGLACVARALEEGDLAFAQIATLLLRLPDPPTLAKGAPIRSSWELAAQLIESGLIKAEWDESEHPRAGEPPNKGRFALKDRDDEPPTEGEPEPGLPAPKISARDLVRGL